MPTNMELFGENVIKQKLKVLTCSQTCDQWSLDEAPESCEILSWDLPTLDLPPPRMPVIHEGSPY